MLNHLKERSILTVLWKFTVQTYIWWKMATSSTALCCRDFIGKRQCELLWPNIRIQEW